MDVPLQEVVKKLKALPDLAQFASKHHVTVSSLEFLDDVQPPAHYRPNRGQETMREVFADLGYKLGKDEVFTLI